MAACWEGGEMGVRATLLNGAALAALLLPPVPDAAGITIKPRVDPDREVQLTIRRMEEFERSIALTVKTDPRLVSPARVRELVASIDMRDGAGLNITRGQAIDVEHDVVIGASGLTAEITRIRETPEGLVVLGAFRNAQGQIVAPPAGSLAAYTTGGERLCFEQATIEQAPEAATMMFVLLIDRSGSMHDVMPDVRRAAARFLDDLPDSAACVVASFAEDVRFHARRGLIDNQCEAHRFDLDAIEAGGSTDLFTPLADIYAEMGDPAVSDWQKAVIILTDGQVNKHTDDAGKVAARKGDTVTFTYFLGDREERWLKGVSDNYLTHAGDLPSMLGRYFEVLSDAYRKQTVLRLKQCPAAPHAAP
jgi:hypothetical protein